VAELKYGGAGSAAGARYTIFPGQFSLFGISIQPLVVEKETSGVGPTKQALVPVSRTSISHHMVFGDPAPIYEGFAA
jgi:hypothetical protein